MATDQIASPNSVLLLATISEVESDYRRSEVETGLGFVSGLVGDAEAGVVWTDAEVVRGQAAKGAELVDFHLSTGVAFR